MFLLNVREEFFKSENMLKLTAEGLSHSDDEESEGAYGEETGSTRGSVKSKRLKKDLFGRVR